jgi:hypothetical protein
VPLVARMPGGIWDASAAQHSQSLEAWFAHLPGVVVVSPSTPQDNHSLLRAALQCGDPVVYIEHKTLWGARGPVDETLAVPLGKAARMRQGDALTLVSWSRQAQVCAEACERLAAEPEQRRPEHRGELRRRLRMTGDLASLDEDLLVQGDADGLAGMRLDRCRIDVPRLDGADARGLARRREQQAVADAQHPRLDAPGQDAPGVELVDVLDGKAQRQIGRPRRRRRLPPRSRHRRRRRRPRPARRRAPRHARPGRHASSASARAPPSSSISRGSPFPPASMSRSSSAASS